MLAQRDLRTREAFRKRRRGSLTYLSATSPYKAFFEPTVKKIRQATIGQNKFEQDQEYLPRCHDSAGKAQQCNEFEVALRHH